MEISAIKEGQVRRLMANAIKSFHIFLGAFSKVTTKQNDISENSGKV